MLLEEPCAGAHPESAPGEGLPESALVGAAGEHGVGGEDGVPAVDETGAAGLELQAVEHQLQREIVAAGRPVAGEVGVEAVLGDERPVDLPERRRPDEADAVRNRHRRQVAVGVGVGREVGGVGRQPDAGAGEAAAEEVGADDARCRRRVAGLVSEEEAEIVAPAFAHLLGVRETRRVARAAGKAGGDAVADLVRHDQVVEDAVDVGVGQRPEHELQARVLPVGRCREVAAVGAAAVLGFGLHGVGTESAVAVVVLLEVPPASSKPKPWKRSCTMLFQ